MISATNPRNALLTLYLKVKLKLCCYEHLI